MGTTLCGWIGRPSGTFEATLRSVLFPGVAGLVLLVVGIGLLRHGNLIGLLPTLASPVLGSVPLTG